MTFIGAKIERGLFRGAKKEMTFSGAKRERERERGLFKGAKKEKIC